MASAGVFDTPLGRGIVGSPVADMEATVRGDASSHTDVQRTTDSPLRLAGKEAIFMAMSETVNVAEFKDRLSELLAFVERGGEVVVCRRNVPLARIEPIRKPTPCRTRRSVVGCLKGTVSIHGDLTEPCIPEADWETLR